MAIDWASYHPPIPVDTSLQIIDDMDVATLRKYIDWTPFFMTWSLVGKYPSIFDHEEVGEEAKRLFDDANALLDRVEKEKLLQAKGICKLFPFASVGDDIEVYEDESRIIRSLIYCIIFASKPRNPKGLITACQITLR